MNFEIPNFVPIIPEMFLLAMALGILVLDLFLPQSRRGVTYALSQFALLGTLLLVVVLASDQVRLSFSNSFVADPMADLLKGAVLIISVAVFSYSRSYLSVRDLYKGEFFVLGLLGILGMMIMISAHSMLTLYLGLELLSLSLYALVAFNRDSSVSSESAMKYFVLGSIASGMLLYGMSLVYGVTGSLDIQEVALGVSTAILGGELDIALVFALAFVVVGLGFKMGAVPFHMWLPDVYHGAATPVTLFISAAPKIAGFAIVMRLLVDGLGPLHADWQGMLLILAVLSLALGNVVAIAQTNIKRMFAYSTIAHVGFIVMAIMAGTEPGYAAAIFYVIVYAMMAAGGFGMILLLSRQGFEADNIEDFKGLGERSPWFAFIMLLLMFSMAGIPPTVGFYAKLAVLQAVVDVGLVWLAVFAVLMSVIGAFYYLRVVKYLYFDKPSDDAPIVREADMGAVLSINGLAMLALGIFPGILMSLAVAVR
ncbi:NADH dehydrogenase subunit N [Ectothiorhodosinus mongolicus]|uniref:NADH-quinone oxidoreductase subunit N n=1 Tax=Ectothiorhodosinus mongolicus TaxID=233100 RepID=A0A1R3VNM4_9GAMM|nr:NADH-quinone oxidoreductase subunit NuoN [Ectothiorhodosinus mongolicus]ULX56520.1 NADH-quinone oxidoreductase subunit NuoN [Ectothiorhodosinus mongolicus]SIT66204.1 NADH dehydrogenase subunit N [Ectothiorhodosinus mongolicus]